MKEIDILQVMSTRKTIAGINAYDSRVYYFMRDIKALGIYNTNLNFNSVREMVAQGKWSELKRLISSVFLTKTQYGDVKKTPVIGLKSRVEEVDLYNKWRLENALVPFEGKYN